MEMGRSMKKKVIVYTWKTCIFCIRAKRLLKNKGEG
ncbi:MAG: hypothetical protein COA82_02380 [Alkaliphilus sp.]|nr:MAG: hypothetical protein COA82_02380 [Alkaliphilus sp.]